MPRNWAGRRMAYALRQIAIWLLRGQPLDVRRPRREDAALSLQ